MNGVPTIGGQATSRFILIGRHARRARGMLAAAIPEYVGMCGATSVIQEHVLQTATTVPEAIGGRGIQAVPEELAIIMLIPKSRTVLQTATTVPEAIGGRGIQAVPEELAIIMLIPKSRTVLLILPTASGMTFAGPIQAVPEEIAITMLIPAILILSVTNPPQPLIAMSFPHLIIVFIPLPLSP